ncbi:MAG TPA: D-arabinono-1,4-lactone oxidase [Puia sp.]|nr:D-arabinono-1,4-lactone oxidase [Puia sp.]
MGRLAGVNRCLARLLQQVNVSSCGRIEQALFPFGAKPHWGKLFAMPHTRLMELYPKMGAFQALLRQHDPHGKFRNAYLDRVVFGR